MAKKIAITIYFDELTGEIADVKPTKRFEEEGSLFKMDVINDAIIALQSYYNYESEQFTHKNSQIGIT